MNNPAFDRAWTIASLLVMGRYGRETWMAYLAIHV